jgi:hypothetical protein
MACQLLQTGREPRRKRLTQEGYTDTTDVEDESSGNESEVLRSLRKQLKEKDRELSARPDRATLEAEIREGLKRDAAIEGALTTFGHPAGILDVVKAKLGDAEVSPETVAEALRSIGYQVEVPDATAGTGEEQVDQLSDLATVSTLSAQVRSAATGGATDPLEAINRANTPEELRAAVEKAGILQTQY